MSVEKEMRELIEGGKQYLSGELNLAALNGLANRLLDVSTVYGSNSSIREIAEEWVELINRRWNEFGVNDNPIGEEEFIEWLKGKIYFEESDI